MHQCRNDLWTDVYDSRGVISEAMDVVDERKSSKWHRKEQEERNERVVCALFEGYVRWKFRIPVDNADRRDVGDEEEEEEEEEIEKHTGSNNKRAVSMGWHGTGVIKNSLVPVSLQG